MPESQITATAAGTNSGSAVGNPAPDGSPPTPPTVSREDFDALKRQNDWLAGQVRKLTEGAKSAPNPIAEPKPQREALAELQAEIIKDRTEAAAERRDLAIERAVQIDGVDAEALHDHLVARYGQQIKVDGRKVFYEDPATNERIPIDDFVRSLTSGAVGDRFKKAIPAGPRPTTGGRPSPHAPKSFSEMSQVERIELQRKDPRAYLAAMSSEYRSTR